MSYSLDFRKRVFEIKTRDNLSFKETSNRFGISIRTLFRWQNRITPKLNRDKPATKIDMARLADDIKTHPDAYQHERAERLGVSTSCVYYALKRLGISNKKKPSPPKSRRRGKGGIQSED